MLDDYGSSKALGFSYQGGYAFLAECLNNMASGLNIRAHTTSGLDVGDGITADYIGGNGSIVLGTYGIYTRMPRSLKKMPDRMLVAGLVSCYYEGRHAALFKAYQIDTVIDEGLIYAHLAKQVNPSYYKNDGNRYKYATEIDAEFYGIMGAYEQLQDICVTKQLSCDPDALICDYVNYISENYSYYIKHSDNKPFVSIVEIDEAFKIAYDKAVSHAPVQRVNGFVVDSDDYRVFKNQWHSDEAVNFIFDERGLCRSGMGFFADAIWDAGNGNRDKMISCITLYCHPEYARFYHQDLGDLSPEAVFGRPFPDSCKQFIQKESRVADADELLSGVSGSNVEVELGSIR